MGSCPHAHTFLAYVCRHCEGILSKSIVLFRTPIRIPPSNSNEDLALWVYSCDCSKLRHLLVPEIPVHLQKHVKFLCDDNDECIYSFTLVLENGFYDVYVLDLREGNCSRWKRLPSLPIYKKNSEYCIYRCSSTSTSTLNGNWT